MWSSTWLYLSVATHVKWWLTIPTITTHDWLSTWLYLSVTTHDWLYRVYLVSLLMSNTNLTIPKCRYSWLTIPDYTNVDDDTGNKVHCDEIFWSQNIFFEAKKRCKVREVYIMGSTMTILSMLRTVAGNE